MNYPAAATVAEIEDLLSDILIRLPVKSLMQFKCVSKKWRLLISSPQFCVAHNRSRIQHTCPSALLLSKGFKFINELQVVHLNSCNVPSFNFIKVGQLRILQSCNGLLLCRSVFLNQPASQNSSENNNCVMNGFVYSICNPNAQSKTMFFPSSLVAKSKTNYLIAVGLAFDPSSSPYYKIVFILDSYKKALETYMVDIYIYSSENDSWSKRVVDVIGMCLDYTARPILGIGFQEGIFCKNAIHWLSYEPSYEPRHSLMYFVFDDGSMKKMNLSGLNVKYFGECLGNLYIIAYQNPNYEVVEIEPDYSGWTVKYTLNLQNTIEEYSGSRGFWILSIIHANNEDWVIISCANGKILSFNLKDGSWKMIYEIDGEPSLNYQGECYNYFEKLISL